MKDDLEKVVADAQSIQLARSPLNSSFRIELAAIPIGIIDSLDRGFQGEFVNFELGRSGGPPLNPGPYLAGAVARERSEQSSF